MRSTCEDACGGVVVSFPRCPAPRRTRAGSPAEARNETGGSYGPGLSSEVLQPQLIAELAPPVFAALLVDSIHDRRPRSGLELQWRQAVVSESSAKRCHELRTRLIELELMEQHEQDFQTVRSTLKEVKEALDLAKSDADSATGKIDDLKEAAENLGTVLESTQGYLGSATEALASISDGVGDFGSKAEAAGEKIGQLDELMGALDAMRNPQEQSASDLLDGLKSTLEKTNELLGGLPEGIPGFGQFLQAWTEGIDGIGVSVRSIEGRAAEFDRIHEEVFGTKLYQEFKSDRQKRREEIERITSELEVLDCFPMPAHDGGQEAAFEIKLGHYRFALANGLAPGDGQSTNGCDLTREQFKAARERLNKARAGLRTAVSRAERLQGDIAAAELQSGSHREPRPRSRTDPRDTDALVASSNRDIARRRLEDRAAKLPEARAEVEAARAAHLAAQRALRPCFESIKGFIPGAAHYEVKNWVDRLGPDLPWDEKVEVAAGDVVSALKQLEAKYPKKSEPAAEKKTKRNMAMAGGAMVVFFIAVVLTMLLFGGSGDEGDAADVDFVPVTPIDDDPVEDTTGVTTPPSSVQSPGTAAATTPTPTEDRRISIGEPVYADSGQFDYELWLAGTTDKGELLFKLDAEALVGSRYVAIEAIGTSPDGREWFTECGFRPLEDRFLCLTYDNRVAAEYLGQRERSLAEVTNDDGTVSIPSVFQFVDGELVVGIENYEDTACGLCVESPGNVEVADVWITDRSHTEEILTGDIDEKDLEDPDGEETGGG